MINFLLGAGKVPEHENLFEGFLLTKFGKTSDIKKNIGTFFKIEREHVLSLEMIFILAP